jgi:hypothetical protein
LSITLNGIPIKHGPQALFVSSKLKPAFTERTYASKQLIGKAGPGVTVKLYAGVAERSLHDGGWYVYCNGRLILRADQSAITVWGPRHQMRAYHPDFAFFRGYAYFDSDDGTLLPWTTTKTGVDADSPIYKAVQSEMVEMTKPVLTFLTELAKEKSTEISNGPLQKALAGAHATQVQKVTQPASFQSPPPAPPPSGPKMQKIQYSKPARDVERAMKVLKVGTYTAVGEKTFDYFMKHEGDED